MVGIYRQNTPTGSSEGQLAAREGIVQLRHLSPRVNFRSFYYYPRREGYGRPPQVANGDHETNPALLHLVRYVGALEELFDQITIDLIVARVESWFVEPR